MRETIEGVRHQVLRMDLDLAKLENHHKNLQQTTKLKVKDIWNFNKNLESNIDYSRTKIMESLKFFKSSLTPSNIFPKIVWLYTEFPLQSEKMLEQLLGNYFIHLANESSYEIRAVNSWNAYQWLSN